MPAPLSVSSIPEIKIQPTNLILQSIRHTANLDYNRELNVWRGAVVYIRAMKCFSFKNGDKCGGPKTSKSRSLRSSSTSLSTDHDVRRVGSELNSQNVSEISTESSGTTTSFTSFSGRSTNLRAFKLSELKASTRNFNRSVKVGEGGFGGVFRGVMPSAVDPEKKIDIAVKQLSKTGLQGHKEWVTEVNVLGVVEHPNLVKLIGYCAEDDERGIQRLLIYEYMPNKSVHDHLSSRCQTPLSWISRLRIAQDAARGLAYLHEEMDFQIIFRDFKSSNILLDDEWNAKLSDFGLARLGPADGLSHVSTAVVGTIGYAAPEYVQTGRLTYKSDVWSYGVFLYELITGRCPVNRNLPKNEQKLLDWIKPHLSTDMKKFQLIIDPRLEGKYSLRTVQKLAAIANRCLARLPKTRPKMSEVLELVSRVVEEEETKTVPVPVSAKSFALNENEISKSESLKRRLVDPIIGENGWLGCPSWRQKLVRAT